MARTAVEKRKKEKRIDLKIMKETVVIKQMRKKWSDGLMFEASMPDMDDCRKPRDRN